MWSNFIGAQDPFSHVHVIFATWQVDNTFDKVLCLIKENQLAISKAICT